eukprot:10959207-Alexandrium_andersonii.AAC.1
MPPAIRLARERAAERASVAGRLEWWAARGVRASRRACSPPEAAYAEVREMKAVQGYVRRLLLRGLDVGDAAEAAPGAAEPVATPARQEALCEPFYRRPSVGSWLRPAPIRCAAPVGGGPGAA